MWLQALVLLWRVKCCDPDHAHQCWCPHDYRWGLNTSLFILNGSDFFLSFLSLSLSFLLSITHLMRKTTTTWDYVVMEWHELQCQWIPHPSLKIIHVYTPEKNTSNTNTLAFYNIFGQGRKAEGPISGALFLSTHCFDPLCTCVKFCDCITLSCRHLVLKTVYIYSFLHKSW